MKAIPWSDMEHQPVTVVMKNSTGRVEMTRSAEMMEVMNSTEKRAMTPYMEEMAMISL